MKTDELRIWNDEVRWDYAHAVLSLEIITPFYDYIGIPFQGELMPNFQSMLRDYYREIYLAPKTEVVDFVEKRGVLIHRIEEAFGVNYRDAYVAWYIQVFTKAPGERRDWDAWESIIMQCSAREGWWCRLGLTTELEAFERKELEDVKLRMDDLRDIEKKLQQQTCTDWDHQVIERQRLGDDCIKRGTLFGRLVLTSSFFMFYWFWSQLMKKLSPEQIDSLWEHVKQLASQIYLTDPKDVLHPRDLIIREWW